MLYFKNLSFLKAVVVNLQHRTVFLKASLLIRHSIIWVAVILFAGSFYSLLYIINEILILITLIIICSARKSQVRRAPTGCLYQRKISVCNYWRKCLCTWRSCIHLQLDSREKYLCANAVTLFYLEFRRTDSMNALKHSKPQAPNLYLRYITLSGTTIIFINSHLCDSSNEIVYFAEWNAD